MMVRKDHQWIAFCDASAAIFSTCSKAQVFSVIVGKDQRILGTGFNGVPSGWKHCDQGGCPRADSGVPSGSDYDHMPGLCYAAHAEINALTNSAPVGFSEATLYVNKPPCMNCQRAIAGANIARVVVPAGDYEILSKHTCELIQYPESE